MIDPKRIVEAQRARAAQKSFSLEEATPDLATCIGQLLHSVSRSQPPDWDGRRAEDSRPWGSCALGPMARRIIAMLEKEEGGSDG